MRPLSRDLTLLNSREKFEKFTGVPHAAATTSCTTALHLAVAALGLKPGEEVIVPAFTWIATANAVEYSGGRPVFCDIDLATYNLDVGRLSGLIGPRTVGIIPVHLFGLCAEMEAVAHVAGRHGLWVVEDAAFGFGARIGPRHAGNFGDAATFSFHPRKAITTVEEGGMVCTASADIDRRVRTLRDHGGSESDAAGNPASQGLLGNFDLLGFNYRMTDMQGALGSVQMDRADAILESRHRQARLYDERLANLPWPRLPQCPADYAHGYQSYVANHTEARGVTHKQGA